MEEGRHSVAVKITLPMFVRVRDVMEMDTSGEVMEFGYVVGWGRGVGESVIDISSICFMG